MRVALGELWQERATVVVAFAGVVGVGYLPLLLLPWTIGALVSQSGYSASVAGLLGTLEVGALAVASFAATGRATGPARRRLALAGAGIALVANAASAVVAPGTPSFVALRILSGAGSGVAFSVGNVVAAGGRDPTRTFAAVWWLMALWQVGLFAAIPRMLTLHGLAGAYAMAAATCALMLPLLLRTPPAADRTGSDARAADRGTAPPRGLAGLLVTAFLAFWIRDALVYSMSERLAARVAIDGEQLGLVLGVASVLGLLGPTLAAARTTDASRIAVPVALAAAILVSATMALGISSAVFSGATLLMPGTGMYAVSLLSGLAARLDPSGRVVALGASAGIVGEALGPALAGALMDGAGSVGLVAGVLGAGAASITAVVLAQAASRASAAP
jgi:hypothetical protein